MKHTKEERLNIGGRIYNNGLSKHNASVQYGISVNCIRDYMRLFRDEKNRPLWVSSMRGGGVFGLPAAAVHYPRMQRTIAKWFIE